MPEYQVNMQKVREREDIEDGYNYLERVPYKPKQGDTCKSTPCVDTGRPKTGSTSYTSLIKSSLKPPASFPKALPNSTANKPSDQATPVTKTSPGRPQQRCLQAAFTGIRHCINQIFTCQSVTGIFGTMHEVAVKVIEAGRVVCNMRSSSPDDAGTPIYGVPSHHLHNDATPAIDRSSATVTFSASNLQLCSRDEDDFVVLSTFLHNTHDEEDFVMVDASPAPANKDDDFILVDAAPWAEPPPTSLIDLPGRASARFLVSSLVF